MHPSSHRGCQLLYEDAAMAHSSHGPERSNSARIRLGSGALSVSRIGLTILLSLLTTLAHSADPGSPKDDTRDLTQLSLEELLDVRIPTVYAASKFEQKVTEAPASVSIITADQIRMYGYRTLADILRGVRGFYVTYDRNYSYLGIRGFSRPGDYNSRVLLLIDGHRVNENIFGSALIGTEGTLDVDLIERVEVIRGPSSSLYGTNAFLGVVSVVTRKGKNLKGAEAAGSAASYGTYRGRISYGAAPSDNTEFLLSGSFLDSRGQDLYFKEFDDPATNHGIAAGCDTDRSYSFLGQFSIGGFALEAAHSSREKRIPTGAYDTVFGDRRTRTTDAASFLDLRYETGFSNRARLLTRLYYDRYVYDGDYMLAGPPVTLNKDRDMGDQWGAEAQVSIPASTGQSVTAGLEYRDNIHQRQENFDVDPFVEYLNDERRTRDWSIYVQDELRIGKTLLFNLGLRRDQYSTFGQSTNPRLALAYFPAKGWAVKFLYGQAFRAPSVFELYYKSPPDEEANPHLQPETNRSEEIALEAFLADGVHLSGSIFRNHIEHLISLVTDPQDGPMVYRNHDTVVVTGVEGEVEKRWSNGVEGRLAYSFQDVDDQTAGLAISNSPRHLGKFNVAVPLMKERLVTALTAEYTSARRTLRGGSTDSATIVDLTVTAPRLMKGLDLSASVYNLFDKRYSDPGSAEHPEESIPQDGRNIAVKAVFRF